MEGFYRDRDNEVTYALTGLISELTSKYHTSPDYIREKVELIATILEGEKQ